MTPTYFIYLLTFLGFPILSVILSRSFKANKYLAFPLSVFFIHNFLYFGFEYSLKGDYADYIIFSIEYFYFCLVIWLFFKHNNLFLKILRVIGTVIVSIGFLQGFIGILFFIVGSQAFEADKVFNFTLNKNTYQTRRYSFGFATLIDIRYTFETYQVCNYLPFEKHINKTNLFDSQSNLNFRDERFEVKINDSFGERILEFSSSNGNTFTTTVD